MRQLRVFEAVARLRSFSRAADELHLTQPAVSAQIRELETHAGLPLFDRIGKRIHLTQAGATLLDHGRAILEQLREADQALAQLKGLAGGTLQVGVISAGDYFFPHLLAEFARRHPGVRLDLRVRNRDGLMRELADNLADLAIMVRPPDGDEAVSEAFAPHAYVIVAPPSHPLARTRRIPLERVLDAPFIVREQGSDTWQAMRDALGPRLGSLRIGMEIGSNETIKQAVIAGLGLSFLSAHAVALEIATQRLVVLDVVGFPVMRSWYVVHRRDKRLPPVAVAFRAFLIAEGARLIGAPAAPGGVVQGSVDGV